MNDHFGKRTGSEKLKMEEGNGLIHSMSIGWLDLSQEQQ